METKTFNSVFRTTLSPLCFLRRTAYMLPEKTAVIHGDRKYSYAQFQERVLSLASHLKTLGLEKHDRVAFLCPNIPALLEAHFAVPMAGGILVAINIRLNAEEVSYILGHSGAKFLFVDAEFLPLVRNLDPGKIVIVRIDDSGDEDDPYETFLKDGSAGIDYHFPEDEEEPIAINYTSGTTGRPKGVIYSHRGAYLNALGEIIETGMNLNTVYLWTLPMFHCNGWCFTWAVTAVAGTHVCLRRPDAGEIWSLIKQEGVTHFNGAPTVQVMLVNHEEAVRCEKPVTVTIAGAPPSPTLIEKIEALNFRPVHVYGLTETYGPHTICEWHPEWDSLPPDEKAALRARQGQAYLTADLVRVVDAEMNDVPRDSKTIGEVVMRGNNVMTGYYMDGKATEKAFSGGWFHSGDLAVWHPDGYIELRDRLKDIIISGGENISTIEIEQAIVRHPAVLECAVVAMPDEKWGERPKAFVTLRREARATEQEIMEFCRQQIAHFKCPASIEFGELPKTSTGKVQKYVLREKEWGKKDKRIN